LGHADVVTAMLFTPMYSSSVVLFVARKTHLRFDRAPRLTSLDNGKADRREWLQSAWSGQPGPPIVSQQPSAARSAIASEPYLGASSN